MTSKLRILCDMDGVITDFITPALKNLNERFGLTLKYEDIHHPHLSVQVWDVLDEYLKAEYEDHRKIYQITSPIGMFESMDAYEGAVEGIKNLVVAGHEIVFVTKPLGWHTCPAEKEKWLRKHFTGMNYSVMMVSHMDNKFMIQGDVLIDDDPRALGKCQPHHSICIAHPWNKEYREKSYHGIVANSLASAADWLIENTDFMSLKDKGGFDAPKSKES